MLRQPIVEKLRNLLDELRRRLHLQFIQQLDISVLLAFVANAPIGKSAVAVAGADQDAGRGDRDFEVICLFEVAEDAAGGQSGGVEIVVQD